MAPRTELIAAKAAEVYVGGTKGQGSYSSDNGIDVNKARTQKDAEARAEAEKNTREQYENAYGVGSWDKLSPARKENFCLAYREGRLGKAIAFGQQMDNFHKTVSKAVTPEAATDALINLVSASIPELNQSNQSREQRSTRQQQMMLDLISRYTGKDYTGLSGRDAEIVISKYSTHIQTAFYAEQTGRISNLTEAELLNPEEFADLEYEYSNYVKDNYKDTYNRNYILQIANEKGNLGRKVAANARMNLDEFRDSKNRYALTYAYLKNQNESDLSTYERYELTALDAIAQKYNGDLRNVQINSDNPSFTYALQAFDGEEVDLDKEENIVILKNKIAQDLQNCETPEARQKLLQEVMTTNGVAEDRAVAFALALAQNEGLVSVDELMQAQQASPNSSHSLILSSERMNGEGQLQMSCYAAQCATGENPELTGNQAAGYMENVCTTYENDVQADAVTNMANTGLKEVEEAIPDTLGKMDTQAAKTTFQRVMSSSVYDDTAKAQIARDTIEALGDSEDAAELRSYYIRTAEAYNIDYTSATPRAERTSASKSTTSTTASTDESSQKIDGTDVTVAEFQAAMSQARLSNPLERFSNYINETLQAAGSSMGTITSGETLDLNNISARTITSLGSALKAVKLGIPLDKVLKNCSVDVQQAIVLNTCKHQEEDLPKVIYSLGFLQTLNFAQTTIDKGKVLRAMNKLGNDDAKAREELKQFLKINPEMEKLLRDDEDQKHINEKA